MKKQDAINEILYGNIKFKNLPEEWRADKDVLLTELSMSNRDLRRADVLEYAHETLRDDEEIMKIAINANISTLNTTFKYASERLRDNKKLVMLAVSKNIYTMRYISKRFKLIKM